EQAGRARALEAVRKNAANALSVANLITGLSSVLCSLNGSTPARPWVSGSAALARAGGSPTRHPARPPGSHPPSLPAGAKLDDFADFTSFGLATALLLRTRGVLDGLLAVAYVLAVFARLCFFSSGVPFTYRGLPCPYASALLAGTYLLTGGHLTLLRVTATVMILFMVDQGFYPHDKVLESQLWKKVVYAGGVAAVLFSPSSVLSLYYLAWSTSYIFFPFAVWSCKV
uniref:TM269 protein n=1 Tax=Dromaius novaehollandiae TaxID=8790 RepID=A0A8C4KAY0_DRONO